MFALLHDNVRRDRRQLPSRKRCAQWLRSLAGTVAVLSLASYPAQAQLDTTAGGDARAFAMGGAGIALLQAQNGNRINPATLAFEEQPYSFYFPTFALRASNAISSGRGYQFLFHGQRPRDTVGIALDSEDGDGDFGVNSSLSFRVGQIEVGGFAVGRGRAQPNAQFIEWAMTARNQPPPEGIRSDVLATGYYTLPTVTSAIKIPKRRGLKASHHYAIGARLKYMRASYLHYIVDRAAVLNPNNVQLASEMNGRDKLTKSGFGMDIGIHMLPKNENGSISAALVIANVINPGFTFQGTDRNDLPVAYNVLKTTATAGVGYRIGLTTLAGDLVDLTASAGNRQLRFGAEQIVYPFVAVRAGYNTGTGFSYGLGLFGFDLAFGKRQPLEIVRTVNF
jgi:hypothetical protein